VTTKLELIGTIRFTVELRKADLIEEAGGLVEAAQWLVGDELDRHLSGFGVISAAVESWDHGEVLDGGLNGKARSPVSEGGTYDQQRNRAAVLPPFRR
jgi:hypothetical protein